MPVVKTTSPVDRAGRPDGVAVEAGAVFEEDVANPISRHAGSVRRGVDPRVSAALRANARSR